MKSKWDGPADQAWSQKVASLAADALLDAKLIGPADLDAARELISQEIVVRLALGDRPKL